MKKFIRVEELPEYLAKTGPPGPFKPIPFFNREGQQIEWYWSDERAVCEWIHVDGVAVGAVLRSIATGQVVGVKIFGVTDQAGLEGT